MQGDDTLVLWIRFGIRSNLVAAKKAVIFSSKWRIMSEAGPSTLFKTGVRDRAVDPWQND